MDTLELRDSHTEELRDRIREYSDRLSPESLQIAADFLAELAERESNKATEELLNIPGFLTEFKWGKQDIAKGKVKNWREIRSDIQ
ncbi:hypothetical protein [Spirulina sp. 06S082]|uniref:hypothetical protein n=1 Tax=Spirulina sp. 06S082 TaxID=3110248 RepID=UPI002B1F9D20|nr:hypothetical protein [Spirulina sp. 06S082]MEA5467476.1 hypothetical protein [Spirulina sp. 06S082]